MIKTTLEVRKDIKKKAFAPIYLLHGDEPFFIDELVHAFETEVLSEDQRSFNQFVLFGKDHTIGSVVSHARRYPMMSELQVIIVKEAVCLEAALKSKEEMKAFEDYCARPTPSTILVFALKTLLTDKSKLLAPFAAHGVVVASKKISDDKLGAWLKNYLGQHSIRIQPTSLEMMVSFVGADLQRMAHEAD